MSYFYFELKDLELVPINVPDMGSS